MNYYEILGVSDDSTLKEIKEKFHNLSIRYHPDKNPDDLYSEEKYKQISEAYSVLSNYEKRKLYDNQRKPLMNIDDMSFGFNRLFNMNRLIDDRLSNNRLSNHRLIDDSLLLMDNSNMSSNSVSISTVIENGVKKTKKITNQNGIINVEENEEKYDNRKPLLEKPFSFF